jgi:altronate dehydratase
VPVIKVVTNSTTYNKMKGNFDVNAGVIIDGEKTIQEVGEEIFELLVKVASGKQTKAERNRQNEFAIRQEGFNYPTLKEVAERRL